MLKSPRAHWRRWLAGLVVLIGLAAWLPALVAGPVIEAEVASRRELVETLVASGRVRASSRGELASPVLGRVAEDLCRPGERVESDQLLYRLHDEEAQAAVAEAKAKVARAEGSVQELVGPQRRGDLELLRQAELALATSEDRLARVEALGAADAIERAQIEDARRARDSAVSQLEAARARAEASEPRGSRTRVAEAELAVARASLRAAEVRLEQTRITAPGAGVVASCEASLGSVVAPGRTLLTLVLDGPREVVIEPDEKSLAVLALGQPAEVSADAFPTQIFRARVSTIVGAVDPLRGTVEVRLTAPNPPSFLIPDMTVSVEVEAARKSDALVIPRLALREAGGRPWVFVHEHGKAERRDVRIGLRGEDLVEVTEGLSEGAVVLLPGARALDPGERVRARLGT